MGSNRVLALIFLALHVERPVRLFVCPAAAHADSEAGDNL